MARYDPKTKKFKKRSEKPNPLDKQEQAKRRKENSHDYKAVGRVNRLGDWRDISAVIFSVANERVARSRAAEHMHEIKHIERLK